MENCKISEQKEKDTPPTWFMEYMENYEDKMAIEITNRTAFALDIIIENRLEAKIYDIDEMIENKLAAKIDEIIENKLAAKIYESNWPALTSPRRSFC